MKIPVLTTESARLRKLGPALGLEEIRSRTKEDLDA